MKYLAAVILVIPLFNGCVRQADEPKDQTRYYVPEKPIVPDLDQCISAKGEVMRCDKAK